MNPHTSISLLILLPLLFHPTTPKHTLHHHTPHLHHRQSPPPNPNLRQAYTALQAWKSVIFSDPQNFTSNWVGPNVCAYNGVFCAPSAAHPAAQVVAGVDLNHLDLAGFLPPDIGLLSDLALLHLNSNRFCGVLPSAMANLTKLFELDLSNNRFVGPFPAVVFSIPALKFLDLRYNEFEGPLPAELFNGDFDAIFVNNNRFTSSLPTNITSSAASVVVFANNKFGGCLPPAIAKFAQSMEELLLINTSISGCLPEEVGFLYRLKVLDVSHNELVGPLPYSIAGLAQLEQLNVAHNRLTGDVPLGVCVLPSLTNFTFSYNFFCEEEGVCGDLGSKGVAFDDRRNCLPDRPLQRSKKACDAVVAHPVDCFEYRCDGGGLGGGAGGGSRSISLPPAGPPVGQP